MLPRQHRLSRDRDIHGIWKRGRSVSHEHLQLRVAPSHKKESRFTVIVPLKLSKRSTVRNRVKRQLRSIVSKLLPMIAQPVDGLLFVHAGYTTRSFADLESLVRALFIRAGLIPPLRS